MLGVYVLWVFPFSHPIHFIYILGDFHPCHYPTSVGNRACGLNCPDPHTAECRISTRFLNSSVGVTQRMTQWGGSGPTIKAYLGSMPDTSQWRLPLPGRSMDLVLPTGVRSDSLVVSLLSEPMATFCQTAACDPCQKRSYVWVAFARSTERVGKL
jgi:hypothetical protein